MNQLRLRAWIVCACAALATLACEIVLTTAPTPVVIVITATPPPTQVVALTPTPQQIAEIPSATPIVPSPVPSPPTPLPIAPTAIPPTFTPQPPQPSPPPALSPTPFLPQLGVFNQGGGNMEVRVVGGQIGRTLLVRVIACAPDCRGRPDGKDVNQVEFTFHKCVGAGNTVCNSMRQVYTHQEQNAPYCAFGGTDQCYYLNIADRNARWPSTNTIIENGEYIVEIKARGKNANWDGSTRFTIQR